jgi:hypothetical protein
VDVKRDGYAILSVPFENIDGADHYKIGELLGTNGIPNLTLISWWDEELQQYSSQVETYYTALNGWFPGTNEFVLGQSFWVNVPASASESNTAFYMMGEVPSSGSETNYIVPGFQMLGFSYPVQASITNAGLEKIMGNLDYVTYWDKDSNQWASQVETYYDALSGFFPGTLQLEPGIGYFIFSNSGVVTNWIKTKPYNWP